jgi:hypothetical protein
LDDASRRAVPRDRLGTRRVSLAKLVQASGFGECYDPVTGEGHGGRNFTWSELLLDMC